MATLEKLVLDAKRISNRLSDKLVLGDSLINEIEFVNEQLKTLRTVSTKPFTLLELLGSNPIYFIAVVGSKFYNCFLLQRFTTSSTF